MGGVTKLSIKPNEESSCVITAAYYDPDGNAVTPETSVWTLTDREGNTINSKADQDLSPMATSHDIPLSGDDLAYQDADDDGRRILTVEATYNSVAYGNGLKLKAECSFQLQDLTNVS